MRIAIVGLAVATTLAGAAHAQSYDGHGWYGQQRGDYYDRRAGWDYPEFRDVAWHIRAEIQQGLQDGWLDGDEAGDFGRQLRGIQAQELAEYREHGWGLPQDDREEIRERLDRLDHALDAARDQGGDQGWGYGWR
ncbi:MAG TPA: hypothetical protein VN694_05350 [Caulobacteraceae bacterium]|nr:hypothetical protein [Caulobacteraceae bacterium]